MQKTKLGMSIGLLSAVVYFTALFGGYIPLFMIAGYILLFEQNDWLKRVCFKAVMVLIVFSAISAIIGLVPQFMSGLSSFVMLFDGDLSYIAVSRIISILDNIISIVKVLTFMMLGMKAYKIQDVKIGKIDKMIE